MFWRMLLWFLVFCSSLIRDTTGQVGLNVTGIRLVGGSGSYEGRVEVRVNGVWGTICDDSFDSNDATVLCRMMNLSSTAYFGNAHYGQGVGPIFVERLHCNGLETHIQQCSFQALTTCYHNEDVSLICTKCGTITVLNGNINSISSDGTTLSTTCASGYNSTYNTSTCDNAGNWTPSAISCKPEFHSSIDGMRLTNGLGLYDGRVQVLINGTWGDICRNSFYSNDASAICNILYGLPLYAYYRYDYYGYGYDTVVHIDQLECTGAENSIDNCTYMLAGYCSTRNRASVVCNGYSLNITDIRLVDGTGPNDGRVELKSGDDVWGTVCNHNFGTYDGHALCRMMNLSFTYVYSNAKYGPGSGPIHIGELSCSSYSDHIEDCTPYLPPLRRYCSHNQDTALVCTECGQPNIPNGRITSCNGTTMTVSCDTVYVPSSYVIICLENGTWQQNETCVKFGYPLNITDMRLVNGVGRHDGLLEVQVNGTWGTVCSNSFSSADTRAVCNILFGSTSYIAYTTGYYGSGSGPIYIDRLDCHGSETHINQCQYNVLNQCSHSNDIKIACNAYPLNITNVRLINGTTSYNGRVELLADGVWGSVCSNYINSADASTLCNMMNLSLWTYYSTPVYGSGLWPMHVGVLSCSGNYQDINQCSYYSPYRGQCSDNDDLSLECTDNRLNITNTRLTPGPYHGRLEIEVNNTWGTVCDNDFSSNVGYVICRMMNTSVRAVYSNAYYGEGTGPVHIDRLYCSGNEKDINNCSFVYENTCTHDNDASVLCYGPHLNITRVRLADGTQNNTGRAEIEVNGTWGTICDRAFDINDADAFCRMLGLSAAQYFTSAAHGQGTGPVHIDELYCYSWDDDLNDCMYLYTNSCSHERDVSILCSECGRPDIYYWDIGYFSFNGTTLYADCSYYKTYIGTLSMTCDDTTQTWKTEGECQEYSHPLNVSEIRLVNGNTSSDGRVEMKLNNTWGTICDDGFGMDEAHVICNMIGLWPAVAYATMGGGTGPILVDDLNCDNGDEHINNCSYVTYDNCNHDQDVSVVCLDCGDPTPSYGMRNTTQTNFGAAVEIKCETGYRLVGNATIICEMNQSWSDDPYCQLIDCDSPKPPHGTVNTSSTTNGTVVSVSCDSGYNLSGNAIITCQSNDSWTGIPTCEKLDCGIPTPENAAVDLPSNATTYDAIAVISCEEGYILNGSSTVSCLDNGHWNVLPTCNIVDCGDPTPLKGSRNDTSTTYDTVVQITCDDGIEIQGNPSIKCQADGTWSDNPVCDSNDCGPPSIANGQVEASNGTTQGSIATIRCNHGYNLNNSETVVCEALGWNDTYVACVLQDCGDPTPTNGKWVTPSGTTYRETATIQCDKGYEMEGDSTISCQDGGMWSSEVACNIRDCGSLENPENGEIVSSSGTKYKSVVSFDCLKDYLLVGQPILVCSSEGTWSGDVPSCIRLANLGESCEDDKFCKAEGAVCRNSKCLCKTGVHDIRTDKCDTMPLYPYGTKENDTVLDDRKCVLSVDFSPGIPVFGGVHTKAFVCQHGIISLGRKYKNPTPPKKIKKVEKRLKEHNVIAPYYAQLQEGSGHIFYRTYDVLNSYETMKDRPEVRDIEERVRQFAAVSAFDANFVLIATWENVSPADSYFDLDDSGTATFQLVLVSNGEMTYSIYIYPCGLMQWKKKQSKKTKAPVWVGYYGNKYSPFTHHQSFTPAIRTLDTSASHNGVSGVIFKQLVSVKNSTKSNNISCIKWYQDNKHEKQQIDWMNSWLPLCPCDISLARWDPWFWHIRRWNWYNRKNFTCVDMLPGYIYRPYGKSCCYDYRTSLWVDERPTAGGFFRYHPENSVDHYKHDTVPKEMCCSPLTPFCKMYYDLRPTGTCYRESPYNFGSFWGDPHFLTLDGLNFTFNGLGEYTLLSIQKDNTTFSLQARTEQAIREDGNRSYATVFSAFGAKDETNASIHVELNRAKRGFNIYGNGIDITQQYNRTTENDHPMLNIPGGTLIVSKRGDTLVVLFPSSGISLNISVTVEMLSLSTIVPKKFSNSTSGLLGNYNGKPEDDFTLPNGTTLHANLTEREVFRYGQHWAIDGNHSVFIYEDGKNHSDYHNATYIPKFLDEADPDIRQEAEEVCSGSENIECVFDYVFTGKRDIALETSALKGNADKTKKAMDEILPLLSGCQSINTTVGQNVSCHINVEDGNNVEFLVNNVNATFDQETQYISFFQANKAPVEIRMVSKNSAGRSSPALIFNVTLCSGCSGHGNCTDIVREDPKNTEYFQYRTCHCRPEYEGADCENVFDGCAEDPCSLERNCTSLNETEQTTLNRTYLCDTCPFGYVSNDTYNDFCKDINECENSPCSHICINTEESYECACNNGYRTDTTDSHECTDIDECEDLNTPHNCTQNCSNTDGSFDCSCYKGYDLISGECLKNVTTDGPCDAANLNCSLAAGCLEDDEGGAMCFCDTGYELDGSNVCKDIEECERNVCPHNCANTIGGFKCTCFTGFMLVGLTTCQECDFGYWGENCQNDCQCPGEGVKTCDPVKGCICEDGWHGSTCDMDINECNATFDACDDPRKVCVNSPGSFHCNCLNGFIESEDGKCDDIDECSIPSLNMCEQICKNAIGSYSCECNAGFIANGSACENINECDIKIHDCEQMCDDKPGSYNCYCYFGYSLNDDRRTCTKVLDPCLTINGLNCSHYCFISTNDAECRCADGFILGSDNQACTDIDECTTGIHRCDAKSECKNTDGSYVCECSVGSKLENNGRTCTECDDFHYGKDCAFNCSCLHGICNKIQGCECENGWRGDNCDIDFDECAAGQVSCPNPYKECVNTPGNAQCDCLNGYTSDESGHCIDINECSGGRLNTCDQKCVNVPGGYKCECQVGFLFTDEGCQDINECENQKSECEQLCENTPGSYQCYCEAGFKLNQTDRRTCIPESKCSDSSICGNHSICFYNNGNESCRCEKGFHEVDEQCEDFNECIQTPKPCHHNCTNMDGSYTCGCNRGYYLANDYTTCQVCDTGTYGDNCGQNCTCNVKNSKSCDHITGECKCEQGWNGTTCDVDIDECKDTDRCPNQSTCNNTQGGYDCSCDIGYYKTAGVCTVCDDSHFGDNCAEECACVKANTLSCNKTNGYCQCNQGWKGDNCSDDNDECDEEPDKCLETVHSTCQNTPGSYKCVCDTGYRKIGDHCVDIDECITGTNECTQECVNTHGNYSCKCKKGYQGVWNGCTKCTNNTFGENCIETCSCRLTNTAQVETGLQSCDRATGFCTCLPNWKGNECEEDVDECVDVNICNLRPHSGCVNTIGWYNCDCYKGYKLVETECIPDDDVNTTPMPVSGIIFYFKMTIMIDLPATDNLDVSSTYDKYRLQLLDSLDTYYKRFTKKKLAIQILNIWKGSLGVNYTVQYEASDVEVASALVKATKDLVNSSKFTYNGKIYEANIASESFDTNDDVCRILESVGSCELEDCVENNGIASCETIRSTELSLPQIIGISVGCGTAVVLAAVFACIYMRRRNNSMKIMKKQAMHRSSLPRIPVTKQESDNKGNVQKV